MVRGFPSIAAATAAVTIGWSTPAAGQLPDWISQILVAADLPVSTAEARAEGVPSDEIRQVLDVMVAQKLPAHEARDVIDEERAARRDHGPVDDFGAFVQSRLQAGLRGRELAAAIRAEHAARGKGQGKKEGIREPRPGRPDEPRAGAGEKGRKDDRPGGKPEARGKASRDSQPGRPARPNR